VGHHKLHQENDTVGSGDVYPGYTTAGTGNQYSTTEPPSHQQHGIGGGDVKSTTDTAEQAYLGVSGAGTHQAYGGVTGDPSADATTKGYGTGDTTGRYGSGTGTDNQYPTTEHHGEGHPSHHKHHLGGSHSQEVTDTVVKPSITDKIVGGVEKVAGKVTSNTGMYQKGAERASGETANLRKPSA